MKLLIINPGSTSTKLALYDGAKKLLQENLEHDAAALQQYHGIGDQVPMPSGRHPRFPRPQRRASGGACSRYWPRRPCLRPEDLGGYLVNEDLCHALVDDDLSQPHASNLGGLLAARSLRRSASPPISTTL